MSKFKEDELYEIFKKIRENKELENSWNKEVSILKQHSKYLHCESYDLYIDAYNNIKK